MKTLVEGKDIIEAIKLLKGENSIINAKGNKTELITTEITKDNEVITLIKELDGTVENEGSIAIQNNILKLVKKGEVTIEDESISFGKRKVSFAEQECDYKGVNCEGEKVLELTKEEYKHLISGIYAISKEDYRPVLKKISFENKDNKLRVVCCDGYRVTIRKLDKEFNSSFLLNEYILKILSKIKFNKVEMLIKDGREIIFKTDNGYKLISELFAGVYPNIGNLIQTDKYIYNYNSSINIEDIHNVINSYSTKDNKLCELYFTDNELMLKKQESNYSLEDKINVKFNTTLEHKEFEVAYNLIYILDTLKCFKKYKNNDILIYGTDSGVSVGMFKLNDNTIDYILPIRKAIKTK